MLRILSFIFCLIAFDFTISQLFLLDILYKKRINIFKSDIENRVTNKEYKYSFKKNSQFIASYDHKFSFKDYTINTNNLGFRDKEIRTLNKDKNYSLVIGDSFVEGVALEYDDTLTAILNNRLNSDEFDKFEFLNAGVSSYSPYIYMKKVKNILKTNKWLKVKSVVILYDKSDLADNTAFYNKPSNFPIKKKIFINRKKEKLIEDFKKLRFDSIFTEQTIIGIFAREIIGGSIENLIRYTKFYFKAYNFYGVNFFNVTKSQINSMYASDFHRLQSFFYEPKWENEGKKSIDFAFENFKNLELFLKKKGIKMIIVIYPWPFELLDANVREKYLNYINIKFNESDINDLIIYDKFLKGKISDNISKYYISKDVHFNKHGNKILSDEIFNEILNK